MILNRSLIVFLIALFSFSFSLINAQQDTIKYNFGFFLNANLGSLNPFNKDPINSSENGQDYLERVGGAIEKGAELCFFHKSGIAIRANTHSAKSIFKDINRGANNDLEGTWSGAGKNIGIGYGDISKIDGKDFHLFLTIGYGIYASQWEFYNDNFIDIIKFGNHEIHPETRSYFSTTNNFLDFNIFLGRPKAFSKRKSNFLWDNSLSVGYRHSLNKNKWTLNNSGAEVENINPTKFIAWYFNYSIGIGYIKRR